MNIAIATSEFVTETNFDGGLANYTYKLAKGLQQFGHRPVVFVRSDRTEKIFHDGIEVRRFQIEEYDEWLYRNKFLCKPYTIFKRNFTQRSSLLNRIIDPNYGFFGSAYRYSFKTVSKQYNQWIERVHNEIPFDIIHFPALGGLGLYRPGHIPAISRLSGSNAMAHDFGGYGETKRQIIAQESIEIAAMKKMDNLFGPSRLLASVISQKVGRPIRIIETPFINEVKEQDLSVFQKHLEGKKYALFFGTIGQIKGVSTIARVIHRFLDEHPSYHFVFVGKVLHSEEEGLNMIEYVKKQAGEHQHRVIHLGKMPHAALYPVIEHADFAALPSRIDNFPNTCIEAMAHGKIVIGTYGNGFEQMIDNKHSGYLVPVDGHDELLKAMREIAALDPVTKQRIEANARLRAERLSPEQIIPEILAFYNETIEKFNKKHK